MDSLNESLMEAVNIEEEVFFGPITDRERKVKEQFENAFKNENKMSESHLAVENDFSKNDSLYKSFSVTESKYDSFDDSLNEELDQCAKETKHVSLRKSFDKLKPKKHGFYDSLEDVCSLVSNMDKCSISCEVENQSNLNNKQQIIEDSLKNPSIAVVNKSSGVNEQVHFDDDSLAILELENTFDDSLEEINDVCVLSSIEFEEVDDIKNMMVENQNIEIKVEQSPACPPRNLFDTSVQIVYEKKWVSDQESSDDKNVLYDSLSNSDFKDVLKDSLEESEKCSENLKFLKHTAGKTDADTKKSEGMFASQNDVDASVHIVHEKFPSNFQIGNSTCEIKHSEINEFSKDSLENDRNVNKDPVRQINTKTSKENDLLSSNANSIFCNESTVGQKFSEGTSTNASDNAVNANSNVNQDNKLIEDTSVITEPEIPVSDIENSNRKEAFTIDVYQAKHLNNNADFDKDLKFQLNIEVTVGDDKCQISSQEVKVLPGAAVQSKEYETDILTTIPVEYCSEDNANEKDDLDISNSKLNSNIEECNVIEENIVCNEATSNEESETINITHRTKSCGFQLLSNSEQKFNFPKNLSNISLLQALDLHDISESFFNESFIQSNDSLVPLNLCCKDQDVCTSTFREESKENVPQPLIKKKRFSSSSKKASPSPSNAHNCKTPKRFQKSPSLKEPSKKALGTKIPVRKIENFAVPIAASNKQVKPVATAMSAEKIKKCQHSPHSATKKTPANTPNKTPHFCKVRNTIFSKVPQIVPSKKYMNIQSPVAQYIKNIHGSGKTPRFDPVLRDCMNQALKSPFHSQQTPKSGTLKSIKKKI